MKEDTQVKTQSDTVPGWEAGIIDGDRVCWIGDSITRGGLFHAYLRLFLATRVPELDVSFSNCGLSGDSAEGAVRRFDWDIAPRRPTVAMVMMGMNDVRRELYDAAPVDADRVAQRRQALERHAERMEVLVRRLLDLGSRVVLCSPTPYDQTGRQAEPSLRGVDDALAACGEMAAVLAARSGARFIDLHAPMVALQAGLQRRDPDSSLIGADRVHPPAATHLLMTQLIADGLGLPGRQVLAEIHAPTGAVGRMDGCAISELTATSRGISGIWHAQTLPFPIPETSQPGLEWLRGPFAAQREVIRVGGLEIGRYRMLIDGQAVAVVSDRELAEGVDLADNPLTPQYRQAETVARCNAERHRLECDELRTIAAVDHFVIRAQGVEPADRIRALAVVQAQLAKDRAEGFAYGVAQREAYLRLHDQGERITAAIRDADLAMRAAVAPVPRRLMITPMP